MAAVAEGKGITQDRYLRKRIGNALYGRFQFLPIRLGAGATASDGVPPYYIGMFTKEVLSEEAEVTIPEIPEETVEQLMETAKQLVREIHTEKRCVPRLAVCVCVCKRDVKEISTTVWSLRGCGRLRGCGHVHTHSARVRASELRRPTRRAVRSGDSRGDACCSMGFGVCACCVLRGRAECV